MSTAAPRTPLADRSPAELASFVDEQRAAYAALTARGLSLDLTRGKPSPEQLDLAEALLHLPEGHLDRAGTDVRNYGGLQGLPELREMFADLLGVDPDQVVAGGNASLTMMHEVLVDHLLHGGLGSPRPWREEEKVTFICPVPGYDRHYTMLESYGIEMVTVPMREDGPDVEAVEALVKDDPSVKGMWIVPTYANPVGSVVTQEVAARLAAMPAAAPDFRLFWDNAYALHHLTEDEAKSADILSLASAAGNPHRPVVFASTSKITFAGAGVAFLAGSRETVQWYLSHLKFASIGPDKVNQLRHVQFFGSPDGVRQHMARHRAILAPKFAAVDAALTAELDGLGVAEWTRPRGGYFVSVDVPDGCASRVVQLAREAGIALTPAGASFPHGVDPRDRNIRLAPSFPSLAEVETAMAGVATCVALAAAEQLLADVG
ncbi:aminotransferase class I/II-fold pyridoxal phosphate-dependent enzyme [Phycicoccus endophyticus]|uniref:Aminotransferase class I/II-fold pyridoxal phosphate-dependent enzyme n=1 Tax=Phycicoccus endophyticus TaxID=1690220 RepID=A0A7G9QZ93_9MICO|nr:aminotransferase class I/II-fold pyridoxal phosphate-dependent enzyme [Phycicoccus endophyticus]NHI19017.1 aminotransferase class I/II-fold pyridoxal phosphate-dependent enzyme [Phycicoccus endophyticus]QNN48668.1 aminotransferase class I/II-fold pyridoxal phosphate-dependent enzyme [Phycicoccus endophyticus]GGL32144.1 putative aminotransferase [Phycicoccus endophyticus]